MKRTTVRVTAAAVAAMMAMASLSGCGVMSSASKEVTTHSTTSTQQDSKEIHDLVLAHLASTEISTFNLAGSEAGMEAAEQEDPSSMIEIEKISPIEISLEQEQKQGEPAAAQAVSWMNGEKIWELQQRLASFYQVEADHVEVRMEP